MLSITPETPHSYGALLDAEPGISLDGRSPKSGHLAILGRAAGGSQECPRRNSSVQTPGWCRTPAYTPCSHGFHVFQHHESARPVDSRWEFHPPAPSELSRAAPRLPGICCYPQLFADSLSSVAFILLSLPKRLLWLFVELTKPSFNIVLFFFFGLEKKRFFSCYTLAKLCHVPLALPKLSSALTLKTSGMRTEERILGSVGGLGCAERCSATPK